MKMLTGPTQNERLNFMIISDVYRSFFFEIKLHLLRTVWLNAFESFRELWSSLSNAVPGKFYGSDKYDKCKSLQDRANFHRYWAWQVVLIF